MAENMLELLAEIVNALGNAQIKTWLFGGWAEELAGLCPARLHCDIDLLYPAQNFTRLEEFMRAQGHAEEVQAKQFTHKRAFEWRGVLVEVFLVCVDAEVPITDFFGELSFVWPQDMFSFTVKLIQEDCPCASMAALWLYRARHGEIEKAYKNHVLKDTAIGRGRRELPLRGTGI